MNENKDSVKYVTDIIKSSEDKRNYRGLELGNKLKVLLISDPDTDKAAAALSVYVGQYHDPDELPGLAHFCEHMLFLGTEKYPIENDYSKYISEHGGFSNAMTSAENTTYYFEVLPEHFEGALDRFAQFFISPLFTESATEREVNAVDSEFKKNIPSDIWRYSQLDKHISKQGHPFRKFGTGNLETLSTIPKQKGIDVRCELLKFHQKWYSANIMSLAILGKQSLDDLEQLAKSLFADVQNKDAEKCYWDEFPYGPDHLQIKIYFVPVKNTRILNLIFPAPDYHKHYKSNPFRYISHLIGHEGPGSLLSLLKAKGWSNSLISTHTTRGIGFAFFSVKVDLTEDGVDHVDDIITMVFQYINMLEKEGPKKWIFEELQQLSRTGFTYKEKEKPASYVLGLSKNIHNFPMEEVLSGWILLEEWNPDLIEEALKYLRPKFLRVSVCGQAYEKIADETETWYGTKYRIDKISPETIRTWENCGLHEDLKLPKPNEFIASNYSIFQRDEKAITPHPNIILNSSTLRVWYKQDDEFLLPLACLKLKLTSPLANLDPLNQCMTHMFATLLNDSLNEYGYDASLGGLNWVVDSYKRGLTVLIKGYNEKQGILLDKILERTFNFEIDPKRFEFLKDLYVRNLKNFKAEQPYTQASYYQSLLTSEHAWSNSEMLQSVEALTVERLKDFIPQLLGKLHVECLIHGNIDNEGANKIIEIIDKRLASIPNLLPVLPAQMLKDREIQLLDGANFLYEADNEFFSSSCINNYYQCSLVSTQNNMLMELLVQIMRDPCFHILRTKEQLGYIVFSLLRRSDCAQGLGIVVQSDRHPGYVDQRIEAFLIQFRQILVDMSEEEFERNRESLATVLLEKPKKLTLLSFKFWTEIASMQYHFNRAEVEVEYLRTITKEALLEFFDEYIRFEAPHRRKLSVYVLAKGDGGVGEEAEPDMETLLMEQTGLAPPPHCKPGLKIEDITKFKSSHGLYPLVQPYMNIAYPTTKSKL